MNSSRFGKLRPFLDGELAHGLWPDVLNGVPTSLVHVARYFAIPFALADEDALTPLSGVGGGKSSVDLHHPAITPDSPLVRGKRGARDESRPDYVGIGSPADQKPPLLLVAKDLKARLYLRGIVTQAGYHVVEAATADEALRLLHRLGRFDLVLIGRVPDMRPSELCKQVRVQLGRGPATSVLVVSEQFDADEAVESLMSGASDYISGPHLSDERVLLARLHVALRGYHLPWAPEDKHGETLRVANLVVNPTTHRVSIEGEETDLHLTPIQFKILYRLARRPGRVFLHEELRQAISEFGGNPDDRGVKSHVSHLRKKLGAAGKLIKTVRGVGYKLER